MPPSTTRRNRRRCGITGRESVRVRSGALLRELLAAKEYSLRDVADKAQCSKSIVHALITTNPTHGKTTCTAALAGRISEVLGVPTSVLFAPAPSVRRGRPSTQQVALKEAS